jgi:hypothetical protein
MATVRVTTQTFNCGNRRLAAPKQTKLHKQTKSGSAGFIEQRIRKFRTRVRRKLVTLPREST